MQFIILSRFVSFWSNLFFSISIRNTIIAVFLFAYSTNHAQENNTINISGYLIDKETGEKLTDILIVNEKTRELIYGEEKGEFSLQVKVKDVLILSAQGYASTLFSFKDSVKKASYFITPALSRYKILIAPVVIQAERELQIISDELKLANEISRYTATEGLAPVSSPISFLYSRLSKREQSKRKVEKLKLEQRQRILLKELLRKYMRYDSSLKMDATELDDFVYNLDLSYNSLNYSSKYELLTSLKKIYLSWETNR